MTEHHILGNICIKCDEPFTPDHPRARGAQGILGTGSAMGLNVLSGGKAEVGPVHENNERCQATAEKKGGQVPGALDNRGGDALGGEPSGAFWG